MRNVILKSNRRSKKGITLVELIVAMTLTSIFAVLCVLLINPIERTYRSTLKLARAQLLADTLVDSIRKECDDVRHDDKSDVWITDLSGEDDAQLLSTGPANKADSGNTLVFRRNNNYTEAIYAGVKISDANRTAVGINPLTPGNTAHSIDTLINSGEENLNRGIVHFGYYQAKEDDRGIFPIESYDYTNPVMAKTYGDFRVSLLFYDLTCKDDKYPAYVMCEISIIEKSSVIYKRTAVLCFAANGSGKGSGSHYVIPDTLRDIEVNVIWDDGGNTTRRPDSGLAFVLRNNNGVALGTHNIPDVKSSNTQRFIFQNINTKNGFGLAISPDPVPDYDCTVKQTSNGYRIIYSRAVDVRLISGPAFNSKILGSHVSYVVFGKHDDYASLIGSLTGVNVSEDKDGNITDDYRLYIVTHGDGTKSAYILSDTGYFNGNPIMGSMFKDLSDVREFTGLDNIITTNTVDMHRVFMDCRKVSMPLFKLGWDTSNVETMDGMFRNFACEEECPATTIDVSGFDFSKCHNYYKDPRNAANNIIGINKMFFTDDAKTSHIETIKFPEGHKLMNNLDMLQQVFSGCDHLKNLINFNDIEFKGVKYFSGVFEHCDMLEKADFHNWTLTDDDFVLLYNNTYLFTGLTNLKELNLNGLQISVSDLSNLLKAISKIEIVYLNNLTAPNATSINDLYSGKANLREVYMNDSTLSKENEWTAEKMFNSCNTLETAELRGLVTNKCTSLSEMFKYCTNLSDLHISQWDVSNVTSMYHTFYSCYSKNTGAKTLDISGFNFNTKDPINMEGMFYNCGYTTISFPATGGVAKASNIKNMFRSCKNLNNVENLNGASFPAATDASYLFAECESLGTGSPKTFSITLNIPNADWVNNMFNKTKNVEKIDISGSDFRSAGSLGDMFNGSADLKEVVMDGVNLANCSSFTNPFTNCGNLTTIHMNSIDLRKAANLSFLNWNNNNLKNLELESANLSGLTALSSLFSGRTVIEYINFSDVTLGSGYTSASQMFFNCKRLKKLEIRNFTAPASCSQMFMNCCSLAEIDLSGWNTTATKDMSSMFCQVATKEKNSGIEPQLPAGVDKFVLDVSSFDFTNVTLLKYFIGIEKQNEYEDRLNKIILPAGDKGNASKVTDSQRAFRYRTQVTQIDNLEYLQLSNTCTNTTGMFSRIGCSELDIRGIHINNAVMDWMFDNCANLERIYAAPDADFSVSGKSAKEMFKESRKIVGGNGTTYIGDGKTYAKIDGGASMPGYFTDYNQKPATGG